MAGEGLRALHPSRYLLQSDGARREQTLRAAWMVPERFDDGIVRAHAFPLRPVDKDRWDVLIAVRFPVELGAVGETVERDFGGVLLDGLNPAFRFNRRVGIRPRVETDEAAPAFTFVERATLAPGRYTLRALMSEPDGSQPHASIARLDVPEMPRRETFLVGPTSGRPVGDDLVVYGSGRPDAEADRRAGADGFQPLLVQLLDRPSDLAFLTDACVVGSKRVARRVAERGVEVARSLTAEGAEAIGSLPPVPFATVHGSKVHCQALVDLVPGGSLADGDYRFEIRLSEPGGESRSTRFAVAGR